MTHLSAAPHPAAQRPQRPLRSSAQTASRWPDWRRTGSALALSVLAWAASGAAQADEATIRKVLAERLPNFPKIDEVRKAPIDGLFEVRIGSDILYTDANGEHIIQGAIIETRTRSDLTQARVDDLLKLDFASLPMADAVLIRQGAGTRKLVVFGDPNCGYCKRLEKDLMQLKDVSIYTFLYPILGDDSAAKSRDIWCAKDPAKAWRDWMLDGKLPARVMGECDTAALERNKALGRKHKVNGTPAIVFEDGSRAPGAMPAKAIESRIAAARKG